MLKKSTLIWACIAAALLVAVGVRIAHIRSAAKATRPPSADTALVRAARVERANVAERLSVTGTIRPRNEVDVYAKVAGRLEAVHAEVGDLVKARQPLAVIEHQELSWQVKAARAAAQMAQANLEGAQLEFDRAQTMFKSEAIPRAQFDGAKVRLELAKAQLSQAEAAAGLAQQSLANARVESLISGTVTRRPVNVGAQASPQTLLFTIQDTAALKMEVSVDAAGFARLAKGSEALVTVDALPGQTFTGKITLLSPSLDPVTRRASVELEVDNSSGRLLPNMFAHAYLAVGELRAALVIPREAVLEAAGGVRVFRVSDGKVMAVTPKLGPVDGGRVAVLEGLAEGDLVALSGLAGLADGAQIRVAPETTAQTLTQERK